MKIYYGVKQLKEAIDVCADINLRELFKRRTEELSEFYDFYDLNYFKFMVIEVGDLFKDVKNLIGLKLIEKSCDAIEKHESWFELTFVLSDDGAGVVVFVPRSPLIDGEILNYCYQQMDLMSP